MEHNLKPEEIEALDAMPRNVRLILKRAWAKSCKSPLIVQGPNMMQVAKVAHGLGLIVPVRGDDLQAVIVTARGFQCQVYLRALGWPNCEKPVPQAVQRSGQ